MRHARAFQTLKIFLEATPLRITGLNSLHCFHTVAFEPTLRHPGTFRLLLDDCYGLGHTKFYVHPIILPLLRVETCHALCKTG